eukprot:TRINITY_DN121298_c0_g1_i1.p1 TRINITY_DN121298_c0_g1~~TRINITY_DN121298_c0_g1_i1.p1  ORF type:complete len:767 (-),score=147.03 TRINITY_DN121298_c0_g1_i1:4-2304(-)
MAEQMADSAVLLPGTGGHDETGNELLLRICFRGGFLTVRTVQRSAVVCKRWHDLAQTQKWLKHCVLAGGVTRSERPALWRRLACVAQLQQAVAQELAIEGVPAAKEQAFCARSGTLCSSTMLRCELRWEILPDANQGFSLLQFLWQPARDESHASCLLFDAEGRHISAVPELDAKFRAGSNDICHSKLASNTNAPKIRAEAFSFQLDQVRLDVHYIFFVVALSARCTLKRCSLQVSALDFENDQADHGQLPSFARDNLNVCQNGAILAMIFREGSTWRFEAVDCSCREENCSRHALPAFLSEICMEKQEAEAERLGERLFDTLAAKTLPLDVKRAIDVDVPRTLQAYPMFQGGVAGAGHRGLTKILHAVAAAEPDVGYCQGMNLLAGVLLIQLRSVSDAFWVLLAMIRDYHLRYIFNSGLPQVPLRCYQFSGLIRGQLPSLWWHFHKCLLSLDICTQQWIITLFSYNIDADVLGHIWDAFFFQGWKAIFRVGVGFMSYFQKELPQMDAEELCRFLQQRHRFKFPQCGVCGASVEDANGPKVLRELLLPFKVKGAELERLQQDFQIDRWEKVLAEVKEDNDVVGMGHLPVGIDRGRCGKTVQFHSSSHRSGNHPPWRQSETCPAQDRLNCTTAVVSLAALKTLKEHLRIFDSQTRTLASSLSEKLGSMQQQLSTLEKEMQTANEAAVAAAAESLRFSYFSDELLPSAVASDDEAALETQHVRQKLTDITAKKTALQADLQAFIDARSQERGKVIEKFVEDELARTAE